MEPDPSDWMDLGPIEGFPVEQPVLRKDGQHRLACVRIAGEVHVVDDRCPHQGYPLSQGCVRGGVLTCEWHNWKFDLASGGCLFGGEPVRRYPSRVEGGRVLASRALDRERERARLTAGLRAALLDDDPARALREALRLDALSPSPSGLEAGFAVLAQDGAERAEYGFDHGLALLADVCSWVERGWIDGAAAFALAAAAVAEPSRHLGPRPVPARGPAEIEHPDDVDRIAADLREERREEAEARVRHLVRTQGAEVAVRRGLLPFASRHFYDYGHGAIFLAKALELSRRFPACAEAVVTASAVELGWATAETALPPLAATRHALESLEAAGVRPRGAGLPRAAYEAEVLAGERPAVAATLRALADGCEPIALLRAIGHAAAVRLARFDPSWEARLDAEVGVLDVTHLVTFAEAAIALCGELPPESAARMAVIGAGFLGKLHRADASAPVEAAARPAHATLATLIGAARARDLPSALALAATLDAGARLDAYRELAPYAAFEAAVRPIFYAHTVKNSEALRRLEADDPEADGAYLRALLCYIVPPRRERQFARIAAVARKFLDDGRPPEGLY